MCDPTKEWIPTFVCDPTTECSISEATSSPNIYVYEVTIRTLHACNNWTTTTSQPNAEFIFDSILCIFLSYTSIWYTTFINKFTKFFISHCCLLLPVVILWFLIYPYWIHQISVRNSPKIWKDFFVFLIMFLQSDLDFLSIV